jgi:hypothetical protein|tara:strand:- start:286 stop:654 length:369 start_codon:yes stop_codon:yes gene_type:complete
MNFLSRLPKITAAKFTDNQLQHIKVAIGGAKIRKHKVDVRATIPIPFTEYRIYYVLLMGLNLRSINRREKSIALVILFIIFSLFVLLGSLCGLVIIYLIKSALGIDLLEGFSLGLWGWFNET